MKSEDLKYKSFKQEAKQELTYIQHCGRYFDEVSRGSNTKVAFWAIATGLTVGSGGAGIACIVAFLMYGGYTRRGEFVEYNALQERIRVYQEKKNEGS